jgi:hypothetical protein
MRACNTRPTAPLLDSPRPIGSISGRSAGLVEIAEYGHISGDG